MNNPHSYPNNIQKDQLIMGNHALHELLKINPKKVLKIFTVSHKRSEILDLAKRHNIPIVIKGEKQLSQMVGSDSHQMIVAQITPRKFFTLQEFFNQEKQKSFILMLDQIFDPQNFGALLRSAECFGVDAVIWSKNRGSDLTPVAAKASCGASELIPLIRVSNLATALGELQKEGYEAIASLLNEKAESAFEFTFSEKTVLIMGSEGEGIQPLLQKKADRSIYIPMMGKIDSLNVAQATAALLSLYRAFSFRPGK